MRIANSIKQENTPWNLAQRQQKKKKKKKKKMTPGPSKFVFEWCAETRQSV